MTAPTTPEEAAEQMAGELNRLAEERDELLRIIDAAAGRISGVEAASAFAKGMAVFAAAVAALKFALPGGCCGPFEKPVVGALVTAALGGFLALKGLRTSRATTEPLLERLSQLEARADELTERVTAMGRTELLDQSNQLRRDLASDVPDEIDHLKVVTLVAFLIYAAAYFAVGHALLIFQGFSQSD